MAAVCCKCECVAMAQPCRLNDDGPFGRNAHAQNQFICLFFVSTYFFLVSVSILQHSNLEQSLVFRISDRLQVQIHQLTDASR